MVAFEFLGLYFCRIGDLTSARFYGVRLDIVGNIGTLTIMRLGLCGVGWRMGFYKGE
jgi:hypothetical protein